MSFTIQGVSDLEIRENEPTQGTLGKCWRLREIYPYKIFEFYWSPENIHWMLFFNLDKCLSMKWWNKTSFLFVSLEKLQPTCYFLFVIPHTFLIYAFPASKSLSHTRWSTTLAPLPSRNYSVYYNLYIVRSVFHLRLWIQIFRSFGQYLAPSMTKCCNFNRTYIEVVALGQEASHLMFLFPFFRNAVNFSR